MYLNSKELKILNNMITISYTIDNIYTDLIKLEIENKSDSLEYSKGIEKLIIAKDMEDKSYNELNEDSRKAIKYIDYLNSKIQNNKLSMYQILTTQNYKNKIVTRTINNLSNIIEKDSEDLKKRLPKELTSFLDSFDEDSKILKDTAKSSSSLKTAFRLDILRNYLFFTNDYINNKDFRNFNDNLIINKFMTSFIYKIMEEELIKDKFAVKDCPYLTSKLDADMFNIESNLYNISKDMLAKKIAINTIDDLLLISDIDYNSKETTTSSLLMQAMIRSSLLIISEKEFQNVYAYFNNLVKNNDFGRISTSEINRCFNISQTDRINARTLSFKIK